MKYEVPCDTRLYCRMPQATLDLMKEQAGRRGMKLSAHVRSLVDMWAFNESMEVTRALGMPRKDEAGE